MHLHVRLYFFTSSCIYHVKHSIPLRLSNFRHTHLFFTHETCVQCKHVTQTQSTQSGVPAATHEWKQPQAHQKHTHEAHSQVLKQPQTHHKHTHKHTHKGHVCAEGDECTHTALHVCSASRPPDCVSVTPAGSRVCGLPRRRRSVKVCEQWVAEQCLAEQWVAEQWLAEQWLTGVAGKAVVRRAVAGSVGRGQERTPLSHQEADCRVPGWQGSFRQWLVGEWLAGQ